MVHHAIIPARFLCLMAHLVLTIMLYSARVSLLCMRNRPNADLRLCVQLPNNGKNITFCSSSSTSYSQGTHVMACTPSSADENSQEYSTKDTQWVWAGTGRRAGNGRTAVLFCVFS